MKNLLILITCLSILSTGFAQVPECCKTKDAPQAFAKMGSDPEFVASHQNPGMFELTDPKGGKVQFPVEDGPDGQGYYIEPAETSRDWILVIHEWYGLNDYVRFEAEKLSEAFPNTHILALDLYDGKVGSNREEASALMQAMKDERARAIIQGAADFAGPEAGLATLGWCFGGTWSLQAALMLGDQIKACVMYYGMPVTDAEDLQALEAPVLGIFAERDGWITPEVVGNFKAAMDKADESLTVHSYDADHAFANPSNKVYNEEAREDAWAKAIAFLSEHLK